MGKAQACIANRRRLRTKSSWKVSQGSRDAPRREVLRHPCHNVGIDANSWSFFNWAQVWKRRARKELCYATTESSGSVGRPGQVADFLEGQRPTVQPEVGQASMESIGRAEANLNRTPIV
jgi:hypothetical protein